MANRMSAFQRKAHKLLRKNGWELERFTGSGHAFYTKTVDGVKQTTTVSSSPTNPTDAFKAVARCANIKL